MSLLDKLYRTKTIKEYLTSYPENKWPQAVKLTMLYGIHALNLHNPNPLPLEILEETVRKAKTIFAVEDMIPSMKRQLTGMKNEITTLDSILHDQENRPKELAKPPLQPAKEIQCQTEDPLNVQVTTAADSPPKRVAFVQPAATSQVVRPTTAGGIQTKAAGDWRQGDGTVFAKDNYSRKVPAQRTMVVNANTPQLRPGVSNYQMMLVANDGGKPSTTPPQNDFRKEIYPEWWLGWDGIEADEANNKLPKKVTQVKQDPAQVDRNPVQKPVQVQARPQSAGPSATRKNVRVSYVGDTPREESPETTQQSIKQNRGKKVHTGTSTQLMQPPMRISTVKKADQQRTISKRAQAPGYLKNVESKIKPEVEKTRGTRNVSQDPEIYYIEEEEQPIMVDEGEEEDEQEYETEDQGEESLAYSENSEQIKVSNQGFPPNRRPQTAKTQKLPQKPSSSNKRKAMTQAKKLNPKEEARKKEAVRWVGDYTDVVKNWQEPSGSEYSDDEDEELEEDFYEDIGEDSRHDQRPSTTSNYYKSPSHRSTSPLRPDYSEMTLRWETDEDSSANGKSSGGPMMKQSEQSSRGGEEISGIPKMTSAGTRSSFPFPESSPSDRPLYNPVIESQIAKKTYEQAQSSLGSSAFYKSSSAFQGSRPWEYSSNSASSLSNYQPTEEMKGFYRSEFNKLTNEEVPYPHLKTGQQHGVTYSMDDDSSSKSDENEFSLYSGEQSHPSSFYK